MTTTTTTTTTTTRSPSASDSRVSGLATAAVLTYVALWLLEGAVRKWIPQTGSVMYVLRDISLVVFALLQYASARQRRSTLVSLTFWSFVVALIALAIIQSVQQGRPTSTIALGLRGYIAPFAFAYLVWTFWQPAVQKARTLLMVSLPFQLGLAALQVTTSRDSAFNLSVSGDPASLISSDGVLRATGTFSDPGVFGMYCALVLALCLGELRERPNPSRQVFLVVVLLLDVLLIAISGARTAAVFSLVVLVVWAASELMRFRFSSFLAVGFVLILGGVTLIVAALTYPKVVEAFGNRFLVANTEENSLGRLIDNATAFLGAPLRYFGDGMGTRSSFGIALAGGDGAWVENELSRWVIELGVLGFVLALVRMAVGITFALWLSLRLRTVPSSTVTLTAVVAPLLILGSINVNPASQGLCGIALALLCVRLWPEPGERRTSDADQVRPRKNAHWTA